MSAMLPAEEPVLSKLHQLLSPDNHAYNSDGVLMTESKGDGPIKFAQIFRSSAIEIGVAMMPEEQFIDGARLSSELSQWAVSLGGRMLAKLAIPGPHIVTVELMGAKGVSFTSRASRSVDRDFVLSPEYLLKDTGELAQLRDRIETFLWQAAGWPSRSEAS